MENDCVVVWTTISKTADGHSLAATLVSEGLAACVNVLPPMESVYRWKDEIATDREHQLIMKTIAARVPQLQARLRELHEYEVPEFIVTPIINGSDEYLSWIRESTAG